MSDYYTDVKILRDRMAEMLTENEEQFIYVLTAALDMVSAPDVIDEGSAADDIDRDLVASNLREIADAVEAGKV